MINFNGCQSTKKINLNHQWAWVVWKRKYSEFFLPCLKTHSCQRTNRKQAQGKDKAPRPHPTADAPRTLDMTLTKSQSAEGPSREDPREFFKGLKLMSLNTFASREFSYCLQKQVLLAILISFFLSFQQHMDSFQQYLYNYQKDTIFKAGIISQWRRAEYVELINLCRSSPFIFQCTFGSGALPNEGLKKSLCNILQQRLKFYLVSSLHQEMRHLRCSWLKNHCVTLQVSVLYVIERKKKGGGRKEILSFRFWDCLGNNGELWISTDRCWKPQCRGWHSEGSHRVLHTFPEPFQQMYSPLFLSTSCSFMIGPLI